MKQLKFIGILALCLLSGCTSLGHEARSIPKVSKPIERVEEFSLDLGSGVSETIEQGKEVSFNSDSRELGNGIKELLISRGYKVKNFQDGMSNKYVVSVRAVDLDTCLPEGSLQLQTFNVTVINSFTKEIVLQIDGNYGCKNTIIKRFDEWLTKIKN